MPEPMKIKCIYCLEEIQLNEDSEENRKTRTDPHHQIREHIKQFHAESPIMGVHVHSTAYLVHMLFFTCPEQPERWKENLMRGITAFLERAQRP
jgi:hypothetical protein